MLGRSSVDVLKVGGYKLSALDIEAAIMEHAAVAEVAVVGLPHALMGQAVAAAVSPVPGTLHAASEADAAALRAMLRAHCEAMLPRYAVPSMWVLLDGPLPRNTMGKVNKAALAAELFGPGCSNRG